MHVAKVSRKYGTASGPRESVSYLLRRTYRDEGKVKHETLANLSPLPAAAIEAVRASLAGQALVVAGQGLEVTRALPHGHVAAVHAAARSLGLPGLLGPAGRSRDLALALIIARVIKPGSKLATTCWWADTTMGVDLGVADASTDEVYAAMDWLLGRQDTIEAALAARHLSPGGNPARMALFDLTSAWMTGTRCPLAAHGHSRDGNKGLPQISCGLLTDPEGRPVAVRVFGGNTADPTAFIEAVAMVRTKFALTDLVMVGDRGMITSARIEALREHTDLGWLTALRAPAVAALAAEDGPLQLTLFDQMDLAEITHPDYPGERLIACRNPYLATDRARKRAELLAATEAVLAPIAAAVSAGRLGGADQIGLKVGKVVNTFKMAKHLHLTITNTALAITRKQDQIDAEAALDGIYVLRTSVPATDLDAPAVVAAYKNLAHLERGFGTIKVDDLHLRPVYHRLDGRVRAHLLIATLAAYLVWHLRRAWAPLTFTDTAPPQRVNPVAPAERSYPATAKASRKRDHQDEPVRSFRGVLAHLATLTRNDIRYGTTERAPVVPTLALPTTTQRRAFELLDQPIPATLK
jgi:hypothetical protein